jgi:hypothetical protein
MKRGVEYLLALMMNMIGVGAAPCDCPTGGRVPRRRTGRPSPMFLNLTPDAA